MSCCRIDGCRRPDWPRQASTCVHWLLTKKNVQLRDQARASTASQLAADMFTGAENSEQVFAAYPEFLARSRGLGFDAKQSAGFLFSQLRTASERRGGMPELFDVFYRRQSNGLTLSAMNPELAQHIAEATDVAKRTRDKAILKDAERGNAISLMQYEADIDNNPASVTPERLMADFGQFSPLQSPGEVARMFNRAQDSQRRLLAAHAFDGDFDSGRLWMHEPGMQQKVMENRMGGVVEQLDQATKSGDIDAVKTIGSVLMQAHSRSGASVPFAPLKNYLDTLVTNLPANAGPSPQFKAAAAIYRTLSSNTDYRSMYFGEKASNILDAYNAGINGGVDEMGAYVQGYSAVSPEAQKAAEERSKSPEWQKRFTEIAQKKTSGVGWWPKMLGGTGLPQNVPIIGAAMTSELRKFMTRHPDASDAQVSQFAETFASENFVLDTTTGLAVKVPRMDGEGPAVAAALSAHSKKIADAYRFSERSDGDWKVSYIPLGTEGLYQATVFNGAASRVVGEVSLKTLMTNYRATKVMQSDELLILGAFRDAVRDGTPLPVIPQALVAKAEAIGSLKGAELEAFRSANERQMLERLSQLPQLSFGRPSFDNLQFLSPRGGAPIDNQLTAKTAMSLFKKMGTGGPITGSTSHLGPAMSLITMGESVMLNTYDDPARGAGKNIGMGYNLQANANQVNQDLERAGVPSERIADVKAGKASITPDQAVRLLQVSLPRYEREAATVANLHSAGLWDKMLPAQKAVMIDIAWQTGNPAQFRKAWASLAAGDTKAFTDQTKVFFTDRSGNRKEDTRRNGLRAAMLAGGPYWEATVNKFGGIPSSKLDAIALNQSK